MHRGGDAQSIPSRATLQPLLGFEDQTGPALTGCIPIRRGASADIKFPDPGFPAPRPIPLVDSPIPLPGELSTMIRGLGVFYPDHRPTQRVGVVPDVVVRPTIQGIAASRDEVLESAMRLIENGNDGG